MNKHNIILKLSKKLNLLNLPYVVLKGSYNLESAFNGIGDLDLFILPEKILIFEDQLREFGFVFFESVPLFQENYSKDYFYHCTISNTTYHIHLHTQLTFGNTITPNQNLGIERLFIKKRVLSEKYNIYILPPELDLFFLNERKTLIHGENWFKRAEYKNELLELCNSYQNFDLSYLEDLFDINTKLNIEMFLKKFTLSSENLSLSQKKYSFNHKNLFTFKYLFRVFNKIFLKIFNLNLSGKRRFPFKGKIFVIVGMDGSGKSSSVDYIYNQFNKIVDIQKITLGSGKSGAAFYRRLIFFVFGNRAFSKNHISIRGKKSNEPKKIKLLYSLWIFLCLLDKWTNLKKLKKSVLEGKICLVDRWPQDLDKDFSDAPRMQNIINKNFVNTQIAKFEKYIYKDIKSLYPDKIIILNIKPEVSLIRKPNELTLVQASEALKKFTSFNWGSIGPFEFVDANKEQTYVLSCINKIIWKNFSESK